ncbi:hypothetical protein GMRT_14120 [Giardia muris]|uniref:Uncharacterized protein n=1 Tax=Giardia muris TaxID=5742 RepID=A0A4Z1T714_GIAMU|nr:hypothetical protein GMRT_14120 [Giardia muris]|eukprot:TNJ28329.1 hypothetical protein GMRT_14120 [Giardia muris]
MKVVKCPFCGLKLTRVEDIYEVKDVSPSPQGCQACITELYKQIYHFTEEVDKLATTRDGYVCSACGMHVEGRINLHYHICECRAYASYPFHAHVQSITVPPPSSSRNLPVVDITAKMVSNKAFPPYARFSRMGKTVLPYLFERLQYQQKNFCWCCAQWLPTSIVRKRRLSDLLRFSPHIIATIFAHNAYGLEFDGYRVFITALSLCQKPFPGFRCIKDDIVRTDLSAPMTTLCESRMWNGSDYTIVWNLEQLRPRLQANEVAIPPLCKDYMPTGFMYNIDAGVFICDKCIESPLAMRCAICGNVKKCKIKITSVTRQAYSKRPYSTLTINKPSPSDGTLVDLAEYKDLYCCSTCKAKGKGFGATDYPSWALVCCGNLGCQNTLPRWGVRNYYGQHIYQVPNTDRIKVLETKYTLLPFTSRNVHSYFGTRGTYLNTSSHWFDGFNFCVSCILYDLITTPYRCVECDKAYTVLAYLEAYRRLNGSVQIVSLREYSHSRLCPSCLETRIREGPVMTCADCSGTFLLLDETEFNYFGGFHDCLCFLHFLPYWGPQDESFIGPRFWYFGDPHAYRKAKKCPDYYRRFCERCMIESNRQLDAKMLAECRSASNALP